MVQWIASQLDFLAEISAQQAVALAWAASQQARRIEDASRQSDLFGPPGSSSRTLPESEPWVATLSLRTLWRSDTAGETESLARLMLARPTSGTDGSCSQHLATLTASELVGGRTVPEGTSLTGITPDGKKRQIGLQNQMRLLPTLTVTGNYNRKGLSPTSGDGLQTALKKLPTLPTLCATDYKSPYSAEGYQRQAQKRSKPLRDTAAHTIGTRLTPDFCEWWMGWPIGASASLPLETPGCHCKQPPHGDYSEDHEC